MQIYSIIDEKCYFLLHVISVAYFDSVWFINHGAWCGLQNFYTEFWNSCNYANCMQIYSKSMKNATLSFLGRFWFCLVYLIGLVAGFKTSTQNFWNSCNYANLCKFNIKQSMNNATSLSFLGQFWFCLVYLIGQIGGGFKISTQKFEIH